MKDFQKYKNNNIIVRGVSYLIAVMFVIFFSAISTSINNFTKNVFYKISGSNNPDSSIVIIDITENSA